MNICIRIFYVFVCLVVIYFTVFHSNELGTHCTVLHNNTRLVVNQHEKIIYDTCVLRNEDIEPIEFVGHPHVMKELEIVRRSMKEPLKTLKLPNTILLHGPPGTGKTTIAKQMSKELRVDNMTLLCIAMSNIENKYYGESLKLLNAVFSLASKLSGCVLFFDEIDGFMSKRSCMDQTHTNTIKTNFLMCIDNIIGKKDIFMIAASNRPHELDPAFLRRMELQMELDSPTTQDKLNMGRKHFPALTEELVSELFDEWTLHDINKFFRFVERRLWVDDATMTLDTINDCYKVYTEHYVLKPI